MLKHLLVHVGGGAGSDVRQEAAVGLARRFAARLTGLFAEVHAIGSSIVGRRSPEDVAREAERARAGLEARARAAGVDAEWWELRPGEYAEIVGATAVCCRYADLAVFGQHERADRRVPADLVERVLLECGRPLLVVPSSGSPAEVGRRVLVAWNASREAARAVNDALPFLAGAEEVEVLALQQPGAGAASLPPLDIAAHLAAHGVRCRYERVTREELGDHPGLAETLLNHAFDLRADLTVVGAAFSERGVPAPRLTRTGRELLRSMLTPLLLSR